MVAALAGGVHVLAVLGVAIGLLIILAATGAQISRQDLQAINRVYLLTGLALLLAAAAGSVLLFAGGKPPAFYNNNPVFHAKMTLFMLLTAVLAGTGFSFNRLLKKLPATTEAPRIISTDHPSETREGFAVDASEPLLVISNRLRLLQKGSILLILIIPVLAYLMARGIGYPAT